MVEHFVALTLFRAGKYQLLKGAVHKQFLKGQYASKTISEKVLRSAVAELAPVLRNHNIFHATASLDKTVSTDFKTI